jgi:putative ABC transport system permease protein
MGIGKSDIILDLRQSDQIRKQFEEMVSYVKKDQNVEKYAPYVTCKFDIINQDGVPESLYIETGDFTVFPIDYLKGGAPKDSNCIALSYLSADELEKKVGDEVELIINEKKRLMVVSGIYQDITNGGKTAKANIPPDHETASWYTINLNVNQDVSRKAAEYKNMFKEVKVTDIKGYIQQTFSNTIDQLKLLIITAVIIAGFVIVLITSLFLKMLVAKDMSQIAIMRSIGIPLKDIRIQYITKALLVLNLGIVVGTVISNTLGQSLLSAALSMIGASRIEFIINPWEAYILSPVMMMLVVTVTTLVSIKAIKQYSISDINVE